MTLYFDEHDLRLYQGDVRDVLPILPTESVNCVVTSPPYYGLRDYGTGEWVGGDPACTHSTGRGSNVPQTKNPNVGYAPSAHRGADPRCCGCCGAVREDQQIGLESSPAEYVETLRGVFAEVRRVLRSDGTVWLNLGDSYYSGRGNPGPNSDDVKQPARRGWTRALDRTGQDWAKPKDLLGIPWRVAFALQDDGWTLRNAIIWHKPNAMPESVTDRLSCRYEHVFLFSRSRRYHFNLDLIREPLIHPEALDGSRVFGGKNKADGLTTGSAARRTGNRYGEARPWNNSEQGDDHDSANPRGRNPGDVWSITTSPYPAAHFATFPPELARRCILAGCPDDGVVLDPFAGAGTTLMVARRLMRQSVGIELNPKYCDLIVNRVGQTPLAFSDPELLVASG